MKISEFQHSELIVPVLYNSTGWPEFQTWLYLVGKGRVSILRRQVSLQVFLYLSSKIISCHSLALWLWQFLNMPIITTLWRHAPDSTADSHRYYHLSEFRCLSHNYSAWLCLHLSRTLVTPLLVIGANWRIRKWASISTYCCNSEKYFVSAVEMCFEYKD